MQYILLKVNVEKSKTLVGTKNHSYIILLLCIAGVEIVTVIHLDMNSSLWIDCQQCVQSDNAIQRDD